MKDVLLVTWPGHNYARERLKGLIGWHEDQGHKCRFASLKANARDFEKQYGKPDIAYIWNGEYPEISGAVRYLKARAGRCKFVEIAWFPQSEFIYIDDAGTNGGCSLHTDDLRWVGKPEIDALAKLREGYSGGVSWKGGGDFILVPLQLSQDTQIRLFSKFRSMPEFIEHCENVFPHDRIIFKKHPKDKGTYGPKVVAGGDLLKMMSEARLVYGINSTVLLEAALIGAPVVAAGTSFLSIHRDRELALAALAARQIPVGRSDLNYWTHPRRGLSFATEKHLGGHCGKTHVDAGALGELVRRYRPTNFLDCGCGVGGMLAQAELDFPGLTLTGIDGDSSVAWHWRDCWGARIWDFRNGQYKPDAAAWCLAWCVEMLEHIDEEHLPNVLGTLSRSRVVMMTAAPPGSKGHHHVNCQGAEYWRRRFGEVGMVEDAEATAAVRSASTMGRDFVRKNALVFVRK